MLQKPKSCRTCPLIKSGAGFVPDSFQKPKRVPPQIILIGQAPGLQELDQGKPFVGRSGDWLRRYILEPAGVDPSRVYFGNTLRCLYDYPASDGYPTGKNKKTAEACCRVHDKWIQYPTTPIMLLGGIAASQFYGREISVNEFHGDIRVVGSRLVGVTFHPAAVTRQCNYLPVVIQEIYNLARATPQSIMPARVIKVPPTQFKPKEEFMDGRLGVGNDLEWEENTNKVTVFGIASNDRVAFSTWSVEEGFRLMKRLLKVRPKIIFVGHNFITSDRERYWENGIEIPLDQIFDTQDGMHTVHPHLAQLNLLDLGSSYRHYFPGTDWKAEAEADRQRRRGKKKQQELPVVPFDVLKYNGLDSANVLRLGHAVKMDILATNQWHIFESTQRLAAITAEMKRDGIKVDRDALFKFGKKRLAERVKEKQTFKYTGDDKVINPDSWQQVIPWAKEEFKIKLRNIRAETINKHYGKSEEFDRWIEFRSGLKGVEQWFPLVLNKSKTEILDVLDYIYPQHHATGTNVDRLATSKPGFQNVPRPDDMRVIVRNEHLVQIPNKLAEYRRFIIPRDPDLMLYSFDYKQIENRTLAWEASCIKMLREFQSGKDFHRLFASRLFRKRLEDITKAERNFSKTVVHATGYCESPFNLANRLFGNAKDSSKAQAEQFQNVYFCEYPEIAIWQKTIGDLVAAGEPLINAFGRRRMIYEMEYKEGQKKGCHFLACSDAANVIKRATIRIREHFGDEPLWRKPILIIHDENIYELPKGNEGLRIAKDIREIMEQRVNDMSWEDEPDGMLFPVSIRAGINNYDLKEVVIK